MQERGEGRLAPLGARFLAALLDGVFLYIVAFLFTAAFLLLPASGASGLLLVFLAVIEVGYYWVPTALWGQTLGKRLLGIKVVDAEGEPPGWGRAAMRELVGKFLSGLSLGLGFLVALFHPKRRALHDLVGGTWVVAVRRGENPVKAEEG